MLNMFNENAKHGEFLRPFPSLLGSRSQLVLNGERCIYQRDQKNQRDSPFRLTKRYTSYEVPLLGRHSSHNIILKPTIQASNF